MTICFNDFTALVAQGYNHIPIYKKRLADMDTPLSVYSKLRHSNTDEQQNNISYLFESVQGGERFGRYSMIGIGSKAVLQFRQGVMHVSDVTGQVSSQPCSDPFAAIRTFMKAYKTPNSDSLVGLAGYTGGLVGYFAYDAVRYVEPKLGNGPTEDPIGLPDIWLAVSDVVVVFDNLSGTLAVVVHANVDQDSNLQQVYDAAMVQIEKIEHLLDQPVPAFKTQNKVSEFTSQTGQAGFEDSVRKVQEYIKAGDVMQVVPSQRMSADFTGDALGVYRAIRHVNPSPYLFMVSGMTLEDNLPFQLVGSSPEILSRLEDGVVTVRPIAGTRPRGKTAAEDATLAADLLADQKEIAEHLMLIDLGRNDVGKVSQIGRVRVTENMVIERYSHVMHIVSNVEGDVLPEMDALDVFKATFPAGTLSGAPKFRAMQIIDTLEPVKRGVYGGCIGYLGWHGEMDTAIAIRTAVFRNGKVHVQAGAGLVADSVPSSEWQETMMKARAMIKAVEISANGLKIS